MSERDLVLVLLGGLSGYCFCFVVEIMRLTKEPPPSHQPHQTKDPADWWKDVQ